ncbi:hypothetical protein BS50DRAFT_254348 [Corynespora cassiicola Philippines]|uniref:RING-type domain-containing protein n=1 Tax=Corynespora cassiicola Philippines TaxID=1448308 RepID=A0A2T2P4E1_CORCC|nr:hypothetical protein BS50DRAFT_254348 [Corynespora cassiicola Philippines]
MDASAFTLRPLRDIINSPKFGYYSSSVTAPTEECFICLRKYDKKDNTDDPNEKPCEAIRLSCGHILGKNCYEKWREASNDLDRCPQCRRRLLPTQSTWWIEVLRIVTSTTWFRLHNEDVILLWNKEDPSTGRNLWVFQSHDPNGLNIWELIGVWLVHCFYFSATLASTILGSAIYHTGKVITVSVLCAMFPLDCCIQTRPLNLGTTFQIEILVVAAMLVVVFKSHELRKGESKIKTIHEEHRLRWAMILVIGFSALQSGLGFRVAQNVVLFDAMIYISVTLFVILSCNFLAQSM